jgi:RimJ/RimL family protein N-acetyltransferase
VTIPREIRTERLLLRWWREEDLEPFARMSADSEVMEFFPALLSREESDAAAHRIRSFFESSGYGVWAVELPGVCPFIGFVGLSPPRFENHFTPCIEIGWRLAAAHWGHGYATEGAAAALAVGFEHVGLSEIVSFTAPANQRSRRVMEKLGMHHDAREDFDHPRIPEGHPLRRHVLYRINQSEWRARFRR